MRVDRAREVGESTGWVLAGTEEVGKGGVEGLLVVAGGGSRTCLPSGVSIKMPLTQPSPESSSIHGWYWHDTPHVSAELSDLKLTQVWSLLRFASTLYCASGGGEESLVSSLPTDIAQHVSNP